MGQSLVKLIRFAIAACFIAHGIVAIRISAVYFAQWNEWLQSLPFHFSLTSIKWILRVIGTIDITCGLACLVSSRRKVALYWMVGWGFLTAVSRLYFLEFFPWNDYSLRALA